MPENREETKYNNEFASRKSDLEKLFKYADSFTITDPDNLAEYGCEHVAVIDAKFKTMKYRHDDVGRNDLFRIHSYTGYYNEKNRGEEQDPLKFCSLVYPAVKDPENDGKEKQTDDPLYGLSEAETCFSVGYLKVGGDFGFKDIIESENEFLNKIPNLLDGHYENQTDPTR